MRPALAVRTAAALVIVALATVSPDAPCRAAEASPEVAPQSVAPTGWRIIQGDILIRESELTGPNAGLLGTFQPNKLWPGGAVPFAFDTSVANYPSRQSAAFAAMAHLHQIGGADNVTFIPRSSETDYLEFVGDTAFNFSPVGRQGGRQEIHITSWGSHGTIMHEIMHSLGFWHEQSRNDRNTYVTIHLENVCQTCCSGGSCNSQFDLESGSDDYGPYDFGSLMHYGKCSFLSPSLFCAAPNYVITVNQPWTAEWQDRIGQRAGLSRLDSLSIAFLYAAYNWRFVDANGGSESPDGSFLNPWYTFQDGATLTPGGGKLFVQPGSYLVLSSTVFSTPMKIDAPLGNVQVTGISFAATSSKR